MPRNGFGRTVTCNRRPPLLSADFPGCCIGRGANEKRWRWQLRKTFALEPFRAVWNAAIRQPITRAASPGNDEYNFRWLRGRYMIWLAATAEAKADEVSGAVKAQRQQGSLRATTKTW
jgi:hypothetical protein